MPSVIRLSTRIVAPVARVFDLARSIDAHVASAEGTGEIPVAGVTRGLIGLGETVTWEARHFGIRQRLTVRITEMDRPWRFEDRMISGAFKSMCHRHVFEEETGQDGELVTVMTDHFVFESPWGVVGRCVDRWILRAYMERFLARRNQILKELAESDRWGNFVD